MSSERDQRNMQNSSGSNDHGHWVLPKLSQLPTDLVSLADYARLAESFMPASIWAYIRGAGADEISHDRNRSAFDTLSLYNRILRRFSNASTRLDLLGDEFAYPILLAPVAYHSLVHPDAELATVAGANAMRCSMIASTLSSVTMESMAENLTTPHWFQLYFQATREGTLSLVRRAESAGYSAIVITLDAVINGIRNREQRAAFTMPQGVRALNLLDQPVPAARALNAEDSLILNGIMADGPSWDDLIWLRDQTRLPILIKGVSHPDDAKEVMRLGCQGVVVSNHGGRALDTVPASVERLPAIRSALGEDAVILLDSGVRRGTDVIKALALGADAVLIGRPQLYALAVAGSLGVAHMLKILIDEFEVAMALTGCENLTQITSKIFVSDHT